MTQKLSMRLQVSVIRCGTCSGNVCPAACLDRIPPSRFVSTIVSEEFPHKISFESNDWERRAVRTTKFEYRDPLEVVWLNAADHMGMRIERSDDVFASWDGNGVLRIGGPETLDPDDSLAQMILHEACHALVEGPESLSKPDWGLEIDNSAHRVREHACLRLQAALTSPYGLREFFAATTNFRKYFDALPDDPLIEDGDPATILARAGWERFEVGEWNRVLTEALERSAKIADVVKQVAGQTSLWSRHNPR